MHTNKEELIEEKSSEKKLNEETISLDKESIKALGADTRINILKILSQKQQTLSDLSQILSLSAPTLKEHLQLLEKVEMIKKLDEGRKWKYYKITDKGLSLLYPERKRIFITLSILIISIAGTIISFFYSATSMIASKMTSPSFEMAQGAKDTITSAPTLTSNVIPQITSTNFSIITILSTSIIILLISFFMLVYYITKYKTRKEKICLSLDEKLAAKARSFAIKRKTNN